MPRDTILHMTIEWNKVTWYSWVAAVIIFGGAFGMGMWVGMQVQAAHDATAMDSQHAMMPENGSNGQANGQMGTMGNMGKTTTVTYACDGGKQIQAGYMTDMVHVRTSDGRELDLPQTRAASGTRYANTNESFVFWSKGNNAFVTETKDGTSTTTFDNCTQIAAPVQ